MILAVRGNKLLPSRGEERGVAVSLGRKWRMPVRLPAGSLTHTSMALTVALTPNSR